MSATPPAEAGHPGHLRSVYVTKCAALGLPVNADIAKRLGQIDSVRGRSVDLSGISCDDTFTCVMDVLVVATGIATIDFSNANLTNSHVDALVHHLQRAVGLATLKLANNPAITDEGALMLLDLVNTDRNIRDVDVSGCQVTDSVEKDLTDAAQRNNTAPGTPRDDATRRTPSETSSANDGGRVSNIVYLNESRRFRGLSFANRSRSEMLLPPSPTYAGARRGLGMSMIGSPGFNAASAVPSAVQERTLDMLQTLACAVVAALRGGLALFMWLRPLNSVVGALMCLGIHGIPYLESALWRNSLIIVVGAFFQQRLARPKSDALLTAITRADEEWQRSNRLLLWVVASQRRLNSTSREEVAGAVHDMVEVVYTVYLWATGRGRLVLAALFFVLFVLAAMDWLASVAFGATMLFFGYTPFRMLRRRLDALWVSRINPFSLLGAASLTGGGREVPFQPFEFTVTLHQLANVSVRHISDVGFVPFVRVKYARNEWLFGKVQEPYVWNATSEQSFRAVEGGYKLLVTVYDDSAEVVGPALQGFVIVDDCTPLDEEMVVPLSLARKEFTLVHELIDDVQRHDAEARRRFGGSAHHIVAAARAGKGTAIIDHPGTLLLRLNRVGRRPPPVLSALPTAAALSTTMRGPPAPPSDSGSAAGGFRISVEPASPQSNQPDPLQSSPPLTGITSLVHWEKLPTDMRTDRSTPPPPTGRTVESIMRETHGSTPPTARSISNLSNTSRQPRGPVVFKQTGTVATA
jgi:hypothetical protein